jgi:hypothetical protein
MGDILKEAIADAKAVRETALANAKMALEEAFTPQLKSMLSAKLREDDDEFEGEEEAEEDEFGGEEDVPAEEAYEDEEFGDEEGGEEEDEAEFAEEGVIEINGVKYAPVVEEEGEENPFSDEEDEEEFEEELDLESIIKELEDELSEDESSDEDTVDEADKSDDETVDEISKDRNEGDPSGPAKDGNNSTNEDLEYEIDETVFTEDEDEDDEEEVEESTELTSVQSELAEYKEAVHFLKDKLHEVNILNAKLLFTNKLFKEFSLDNNQKLKVVETFDRTQSTREIKLVYSTLAEQFSDNSSTPRKHNIKESASSKSGSTRPSKESQKVITEEAQVANRFKKLAGIL